MLKQRIITSLVLTPFVIWGVFSLPAIYFALFILIIVGLASWEWGHLAGLEKASAKTVYTASALIVLALLVWFMDTKADTFYILLYISIAWWLFRVVRIIIYKQKTNDEPVQNRFNAVTALSIIVSLIIPFYSIIYLRNIYQFPGYLFYLLMLIWSADVFAYFSGKYLGKNKLAPHVSPGKTWEGVYGALAGTFIGAVIGSFSFGFNFQQGLMFFGLSIFVVVISIFGDLSESLYKRQNKIKDSGNLLPGHGGMLDRVDSLSAAAPFYVAGLALLDFLK